MSDAPGVLRAFARRIAIALMVAATACAAHAQGDRLSRARALLLESNRLIDRGELQAGARKAADALAIYKALPSDNAQAVMGRGDANYLVGRAFHRAGKDAQALQYWARAVSHYQRLSGGRSRQNLHAVLEDMLPLLLEAHRESDTLKVMAAIVQLEKELGLPAARRAVAHGNLGVMLMRVGRLEEAERELARAVALSREGKASAVARADALYNLGLVQNRLRHPSGAEKSLRAALALLAPVADSGTRRATILLDLADSLKMLRKPEQARRELERALQLAGADPGASLLRAKLLVNLANDTYYRLGRKKEAVGVYREALRLAAGRKGAEEIEAGALVNIANYLSETGGMEEAIGMYRRALAKQEAGSTSRQATSAMYRNFGILLVKSGRRAEGLQELLKGLRIEWASLAADLPAQTPQQKQLAIDARAPLLVPIYYAAFGSPETGGAAYEAALRMKALYSEASRMDRLVLRASAPAATAAKYARYAELRREISRRILEYPSAGGGEDNARLASEAQRLELELKGDRSVFRPEARMTPTRVADVTARLRPGEVLLEYVAYRSVDPKTLKAAASRYGVFVVNGSGGRVRAVDLGEQAAIDEVVAEFRKRESAQADPVRGRLDENALAAAAGAVRARVLDPALKGIAAPKRIYVAPDGVVGLIPFEALPTGRRAGRVRYLVEDVEVIYLLTGRDLARRRAAGAKPGKDVWLVGDPTFAATPTMRLAAASTPPAVALAPARTRQDKGVVLAGGPVRPPGSADSEVPHDWIRLESTRTILAAAAQATRSAGLTPRILVGASASEERVYAIRRPRALVFATHGYFMASPPTMRLRIHSGAGKGGSINPDFFEAGDPLQRSMLILAGANDRRHRVVRYATGGRLVTEAQARRSGMSAARLASAKRELGDGLMTAYEVMGMDLSGTQLVVLTACESGLGVTPTGQGAPGMRQAEGESVAGLRQAFTVAGARSLVMSLWSVPLAETAAQMKMFLDGWLGGKRPRYEAFRASQLAALERARRRTGGGHPFWWAGFVYAGDPGDR